MFKTQEINRLITGYANGFITDDEFNDMCDLVLNETTTINK